MDQVPDEECRRVADAFTRAGEVNVFPYRWESIGYIVINADQLPYVLFDMLIDNGEEVRIFDEKTGYGELVEINDGEPPTAMTTRFGEYP